MPFSDFRLAATATNRARAARFALMGAVAALALGAPAAASLAPARAETAVTAPAPATNAPTSFADVVDRVKPAVVAIKVKGVASDEAQEATGGLPGAPDMSPDDPMYHFFKRFGEQRPGGHLHGQMTMSQGSGFIVSADGYVVTNNHVVEHATEVEVTLDSGKSLPAKVIGTDKRTDLALIKINDGEKLPFVEWASGNPRIGDWVIAVGNPFGLGGSVTAGIVSARGRDIGSGPYDDFLQIDAPVNRGNSGGPAFDSQGRVIGVNTAIFSPSGGSVGIGFAIPAEVAKDVVASLREHGAVSRGWIGVKIQNITPEIAESMGLKSTKGALVSQPQRGGPADAAGLKAGDVVVAVNGEKIDGPRDLARRIAALGPKKSADIVFLRGGAEKSVRLTLGALPEEKQARADTGSGGGAGEDVAGLGVEVAPAAEVGGAGREGVVVTNVDPDGAAALKGVRRGDVIVEASGRPINSGGDLASVLDSARSEGRKSVLLRVRSGDGMKFIALPTKVG
jgi:serine protease Do